PLGDVLLARVREAVAREVDEIGAAAELEEIELARGARRARDAREALAARERVEEARFPDIRAPGEADLGPPRRGQLRLPRDADDEPALLREELAAGFEGVGTTLRLRLHLGSRLALY